MNKVKKIIEKMKKFLSFELLVFLVAIIIDHSNCEIENPTTASKTINFDLYKYQHISLTEALADTVKKPDLNEKAVGKTVEMVADEMPGVDKIYSFASDLSEKIKEYKNDVKQKKKEGEAIVKEIQEYVAEWELHKMLYDLGKALYNLEKAVSPIEDLSDLETEIWGIINILADPSSPFQKMPALAVPLLLDLPDVLELVMNMAQNETKKAGKEMFITKSPCNLAYTIKSYFRPTLFDRLDEIQVNTDNNRFKHWGKCSAMRFSLDYTFNPNGYTWRGDTPNYVSCERRQGNQAAYDAETRKAFPRTSTNIIGHQEFDPVSNDIVYLKDNLGDENVYFVGKNSRCRDDYFALVRDRLELEFGAAYKKAMKFCTDERHPNTTGIIIILHFAYFKDFS